MVGCCGVRDTRLDDDKVSVGVSLCWTRRLVLLGAREGDGLASGGMFSFLLRLDLSCLGICLLLRNLVGLLYFTGLTLDCSGL